MRTTEHIEQFRLLPHQDTRFRTTKADGMNGVFKIPYSKNPDIDFFCIVSNGIDGDIKIDWEHVSVRARSRNGSGRIYERVPNWAEMCWLKDMFWQPEEVVVQYHPRHSEYVNIHPNVLHLWRFKGEMPTPPKICV